MKIDRTILELMSKAQLITHIYELYDKLEAQETKKNNRAGVYTGGAPKWVQNKIEENIKEVKDNAR